MTLKPILNAALVALALVTAPMGALAQEDAPLTAETVTDAKVKSFVVAVIALESLRTDYIDRIGNAETEEAQNELRAEADRVAVQLVDKVRGITSEEYLVITKISQESPELTARISAQVDVMRAQKKAFETQQAEAAKAAKAQKAAEAQRAAQDMLEATTTTE